jgi:hypothetical protein
MKEKKRNLKTWVLIVNLIIASIAFSHLLGAQEACPDCPDGGGTSSEGEGVSGGSDEIYAGEMGGAGGAYENVPGAGGSGGGFGTFPNPGGVGAGPGASPPQSIGPGNIPYGGGGGCEGGSCGPQAGGLGGVPGGGAGGGGMAGPEGGTGGSYGGGLGGLGSGMGSAGQGISNYFSGNLLQNLGAAAAIGGIGATIGGLAGGEKGGMWGFISGFAGATAYQIAKGIPGISGTQAALIGLGVAILIFILTYKKIEKQTIEFKCLTWQPPFGGENCELCNDFEECTDYTCKSLGQACQLVNQGTEDAMCVWANPHDTNSPIIKILNVTKEHKFEPDKTRPTGTGVTITQEKEECIEPFTPLSFTFTTKDSENGLGEPSQCKIDYNLTSGLDSYERMSFYVGGSSIFSYNHTETLSLPGPDHVNEVAPELKNDGTYTLYIRCADANGNFNQDAFSVRFCVKPGPDTTPPLIVNTNIPSGNPIQYNQTKLDLEVYVNEPSECRWSREESTFENMKNKMDCDLELWQMNNENVYTCKTTLTGLEDRKENKYYFRCKDKPWASSDRNVNKQSYIYVIMGTQPLNILETGPIGTIRGATDGISIDLYVKTDNGYNNGEAICYFSTTSDEEDYIRFWESNTTNIHKQRQDLPTGDYTYYFKCVDLAGNADYNQTSFTVLTDRLEPIIIRFYQEDGQLKIITHEKAECSYSFIDCNFDIEDGIKMSSFDFINHFSEWETNHNYHIRCKDEYNNQPNPNTCSIIVRPSELTAQTE